MASYVIDENVFENAITNKKPNGTPAISEKIFAYKFFQSADTMFINKIIKTKFIKKLPQKISTNYKSVYLDNHIIPLLTKTIFDSARTKEIDGTKTEFKGVKDCDIEFVGVAIQSTATLITADEDLVIAVDKDEFASKKCKCMTTEKAIEKP
jgi:hypothetical protein